MCGHNRLMRYENINNLQDKDFKRLTGVSLAAFEKMLAALKSGLRDFWPDTKPESGRSIVDDTDVLVRIPTSVSYWCDVWCQRDHSMPNHQKGWKRVDEIRLVSITSPKGADTADWCHGASQLNARKKSNESITAAKRNDIPKKRSWLWTGKPKASLQQHLGMAVTMIFNFSKKAGV